MADVAMTLTTGLLLSDNGGDYIDEVGPTQRQSESKARVRTRHYRRDGKTVSFDNQIINGEQEIEIKGNHTVF